MIFKVSDNQYGRSHPSDSGAFCFINLRQVLNEKQLHTLRTCYGANPRPDALMKEQLVEMTGLSPVSYTHLTLPTILRV